MSTNSQKKTNFHFVTGNPQTDTEKRTVRTIVRSNASNRRWRLVRETAAKSKASGLLSNDPSVSPSSDDNIDNLSPQSSFDKGNERQQKKERLTVREGRRLRRTSPKEVSLTTANPIKIVNLAQSYLGAMPDSEVSKQSINRVLMGTAMSYAQLFPAGRNLQVSQMAKDWFQQCLQTRGILHTALFCQARRAQAMRPNVFSMSGNELMLCQTEAVHAINDKLLQESTATDDESLRIVFSLTWHGPAKQASPRPTPRQAPMADLQSLRLFTGHIARDPVHARGLDRMVALRGGIDTIKTPGLGFLISYGDILGAVIHLRRPIWNYESYASYSPNAMIDQEWLRSIHRPDHTLASLGDGFSALSSWIAFDKASQLQSVLQGLAEYTKVSDDFTRQSPAERNRALMSDQRNMIQHRLMSLCLSETEAFDGRDLFEVIWLAAVAYSMIAVFPVAPNVACFDRLAHMIRLKLSNPQLASWRSRLPDLVLWIIVMGALCSIGTGDRYWYVNALKQERDRIGSGGWAGLKLQLMDFLWFPLVSDPDMADLWEDVQQSSYVMPWEDETPSEEMSFLDAFRSRSRSESAVTPSITTTEKYQ